jgi:hypothetical protein
MGLPGGSPRWLMLVSERPADAQVAFGLRVGRDQATAERLGFLAGLESGEDLPRLTVDDDEGFHAVSGGQRPTALVPAMSDSRTSGLLLSSSV